MVSEATLAGLRLVVVGTRPAALLCARLMASWGAEVCCVPVPGDVAGAEHLLPHEQRWYQHGLRMLDVDWRSSASRAGLRQLIAAADMLVDARPPAAGAADFYAPRAELIVCRMTPFGLQGRYAQYEADDITLYAMAGLMHSTGDAQREPLNANVRIAQSSAAVNACTACLMALYRRQLSGQGDFIDLSIHECALDNYEIALAEYLNEGKIARRSGDAHVLVPWQSYACADGEAVLVGGPMRRWARIGEIVEDPELRQALSDARFARMSGRIQHRAELEQLLRRYTRGQTRQALFHAGQRIGLAWASLQTLHEALDDAQFKARGFFESVQAPGLGTLRMPAAAYRMPGVDVVSRPETRLTLQQALHAWREASSYPAPAATVGEDAASGLLSGVKVIDFTHDWAGPHAARLLADYGAEVYKIEYPARLDGMRGAYPERINFFSRFWQLHRNKKSVEWDLREPDNLRACHDLIRSADVVLDNSRPGVMDRLGLGFERLREINPRLVMVSMSAFGASGPYREYAGYGGTIEAVCGLQSLTGYTDESRRYRIREMDVINGMFGTCAVMTGLLQTQRSGRAQWVDLAETETCAWIMGEHFADASIHADAGAALGNRHAVHAPQGCYRCADRPHCQVCGASAPRPDCRHCAQRDTWLTLCVRTPQEWQALARLIGAPALAEDPALQPSAARRQRHDELDALIAAWTRTQDPVAAMQKLQAAGIAAGHVANARDIAEDPHLQDRRWLVTLGNERLPGLPFHPQRHPGHLKARGPDLGANTAELCERLGVITPSANTAPKRVLTAFDN